MREAVLTETRSIKEIFDLSGRVAVVTGAAGLLGPMHCEALAEAGVNLVLSDIDGLAVETEAERLSHEYNVRAIGTKTDVTSGEDVEMLLAAALEAFGRVDILINNAAANPSPRQTRGGTVSVPFDVAQGREPVERSNPKVEAGQSRTWSRLENFPRERWDADLAVGLTGAFLTSRVLGSEMARRGGGVILNVCSDLALIGPDQRIYRIDGVSDDRQPAKPVSYSVVKHGLLGLTRYLATYWADAGVRVNAVSPGGVRTSQDEEFVTKLTQLIPMGRMARRDEYKGAVLFLCSDASSYMTGANLVIDGGRTCW